MNIDETQKVSKLARELLATNLVGSSKDAVEKAEQMIGKDLRRDLNNSFTVPETSRKISDIEQSLRDLTSAVTALEALIEKHSAENITQASQIGELRHSLRQISHLPDDVNDLGSKLANMADKVSEFKLQMDASNKYSEDVSNTQLKLEEENIKMNEDISKLSEELQNLMPISKLAGNISDSVQALSARFDESKLELEDAARTSALFKDSYPKLQAANTLLASDFLVVKNKLQEYESIKDTANSLKQTLEGLKVQHSNMLSRIDRSESNSEKFLEDQTVLKNSTESLAFEIKDVNDKVSQALKFPGQVSDMENSLSHISEQMEEVVRKADESKNLFSRMDLAQNQLKNDQVKLRTSITDFEFHFIKLSTLSDLVSSMDTSLSKLTDQLGRTTHKVNETTTSSKIIKDAHSKLARSIDELKHQLGSINENLATDIKSLKQQISPLHNRAQPVSQSRLNKTISRD